MSFACIFGTLYLFHSRVQTLSLTLLLLFFFLVPQSHFHTRASDGSRSHSLRARSRVLTLQSEPFFFLSQVDEAHCRFSIKLVAGVHHNSHIPKMLSSEPQVSVIVLFSDYLFGFRCSSKSWCRSIKPVQINPSLPVARNKLQKIGPMTTNEKVTPRMYHLPKIELIAWGLWIGW